MTTDPPRPALLDRSVFRSKVARRVFSLIIVAALAPILIIAALVYGQITIAKTSIEKRQMHVATKAAGMRLLELLADTETKMRYLATLSPQGRSQAFRNVSGEQLVRYAVFNDNTRTEGDSGVFPAISAELNQRAARNRATLLTTDGSSANPLMFMAVGTPKLYDGSTILLAEINPSAFDSVKLDDNDAVCVLTVEGKPLYCDARIPADVLSNIRAPDQGAGLEVISWEADGADWEGGIRTIYTEPRYQVRSLLLLVAAPAIGLPKQALQFYRVFPPAILLTMFVVALVSITLIRRLLAPMDQLKAATRSFSDGRLVGRVRLDSNDEFQDLGNSFNAMAEDLEHQFRMLEISAELDRMVLSAQGADEIIAALLDRLPEIADCDAAAVLLLDGRNVKDAQWRFETGTTPVNSALTHEQLSQVDYEELSQCADCLSVRMDDKHVYCRPLFDAGMRVVLCVPVRQQNELSAIICLGYRNADDAGAVVIGRAQSLADRASVAFSNAAWEERLYQQAHYDTLTSLPNRQLFNSRLDEAIASAERHGQFVALLFIDVDRFKTLNDSIGHHAGDAFLDQMSRVMSTYVVGDSTLARLGGDEFTVIVPGLVSRVQAMEVTQDIAERLRTALASPVSIDGHDVKLSASIGIAMYPIDALTRVELMRCADQAMYHSKERGRDGWSYYSEEINASALERLELGAALAGALERQEFLPFYQPKVDSNSGELTGAELLLRWRHPTRGMVSPAVFIPVAEQAGLIVPIGAWVLEQACLQLAEWKKTGRANLSLAVNVSALQLRQSGFVEFVTQTAQRHGVNPGLLELEVTESMCAEDPKTASQLLNGLTKNGFSVSIDDFGTGHSWMSYLRNFSMNSIKVDQSFVRGLPEDFFNKAITNAIVAMAHAMNCTVVAEGVETEAQLDYLRDLGCERVQGFFIAKPMPIADFETWADSWQLRKRVA